MALDRCTECGTIEGKWREPTVQELVDAVGCSVPEAEKELNEGVATDGLICVECDSIGSYQGIPEHDDFDLER